MASISTDTASREDPDRRSEAGSRILRAGVVGLGVGERYLVSYARIPGVEVHAVCDLDDERLARVAREHEVAHKSSDYRRVTEDPDIDLVSICSYDDSHVEQAISAFRHGKHVMIEKPIALYRQDAEALLRAQQDSGKFITSNLILRESPRFKELKQQIEAGDFGEIFAVEGDYVHDILWKITRGWRGKMAYYSTIFGGGIHLIDLMRWLIGQEVVEVCGMGNKVLTRDTDYRFDDTFMNVFRFAGGALGKCLSTFGPQHTKFHALKVYGTKRTFVNDTPDAKMFDGDQPENQHAVTTPYPGMRKGDLLPEFVEAIRAGQEPNVGTRDVFRVMDICFAASEAVAKGRTQTVDFLI